ncbi:integrase [Archaeoglobales archaeon]|nr:MAG: integrase [Archaeoglobales archaeon]
MPTQDWKVKIQKLLDRISKSQIISEKNKKLLVEFYRELKVNDYSDARIHKLLNHMVIIAENMPGIDLEKAGREDIKRIAEWVQDRNYSAETKKDYRVALRVFYKWLDLGDVRAREVPERVKLLRATVKNQAKKLPNEILTEEEVRELIRHATNPRTKCLIALLWETGARMGELIDLKVKDIVRWRHGYQLILNGKTGSRRVPIIVSEPYINEWLDKHPLKDSAEWPDVWLWVEVKKQNHRGRKKRVGEKANYHALVRDIQRAAKRAGITKAVNPHNFRHSRATFMANYFTEAQMNQWFGWVPASRMPARYVHLSGRDIDRAYAVLCGVEGEETRSPEFVPKECPRCGLKKLPPDSKFCTRCGAPIDPRTLMEIEEAERRIFEKFVMLRDEDVMKVLEVITKLYKFAKEDPDVAKKLEFLEVLS